MSEKNILMDNVKKLFLEKESRFSSENGEIHPIYEAVAALIISQLNDEYALNRLLSSDKESLKSVIATDKVIENLKESEQKNELRTMLASGNSLDDIIERGALYLSENKRIQNGEVLHQIINSPKNLRKYILRAMEKANPREIYINNKILTGLEERAIKIKRRRKIKLATCFVLATSLSLVGYNEIKKQEQTENYQKTEISILEKKIAEKKSEFSLLETQINTAGRNKQERGQGLSNLEAQIAEKKDVFLTLQGDIEEKKKELSSLEKKYLDVNKLIEENRDLKPYLAIAYNSLGFDYSNKGEKEKAIEAYKKAINFNPDQSYTYNNLGVVYYDQGKYEQAVVLQEKALNLNPNNDIYIRNLGMNYEKLEDKDKALQYYKKYLEIKPDGEYATKIKEWIKKLEDKNP